MAQLNLYLDDGTLKKIQLAAKREHKSISKWVSLRLEIILQTAWPAHYFDLFGCLSEEKMDRPGQSKFSEDVRGTSL